MNQARLAQWQSNSFTRSGSGVQFPQRAQAQDRINPVFLSAIDLAPFLGLGFYVVWYFLRIYFEFLKVLNRSGDEYILGKVRG